MSSIFVGTYLCIALYILNIANGFPQSPRYYSDIDLLLQDEPSAYPDEYVLPNSIYQNYVRKRSRGINKRLSLNDLLKKLQAIYGRDDIFHNGRSTYVRFGPSGKR